MKVFLSTKNEFDDKISSEDFMKLSIPSKDVKAAKKCVNSFIKKMKTISSENGYPSFYYTALIVMNMMSENILKSCSPEYIKKVMSTAGSSIDD